MILLLTNFLKASSIVGALSIGLSIPGLWLYRKRPRVWRVVFSRCRGDNPVFSCG
ncbi:Uncharacterised protein [Leclercia adecarboxylata]|uniref:Uncharacterized protein n=1 Tax=Leclercia adecarboxylata TaxID=83655 RepID=A0A4V6JI13_9ENTR|nr:Uncharacterised protein [Leclercia adecarboxylata]